MSNIEIWALRKNLDDIFKDIEDQLEIVNEMAESMRTTANRMRNADGSFTITPLLVAKAQVLVALANLQ